MGASMSWLSGLLWSKKEIRILILGLVFVPSPCLLVSVLTSRLQDNAGKTTLLYRLKVRRLILPRLESQGGNTDVLYRLERWSLRYQP
jgi:ADP-ribosylation factor-like protein 1